MNPPARTLPHVVGVLNVTPDSFYAGSRVQTLDSILGTASDMVDAGADYLEVGGESTGPGSSDVSLEDERRRVIPSVEAIRKEFPGYPVIVDTWKAAVAREALAAGATIINDVSAGRADSAMFSTVAGARAGIVLMFSKDSTPRTTVQNITYDHVITTIRTFLIPRIAEARRAGISSEKIIVDPGLGHFVSADPVYSYEILSQLHELSDLGSILISPSRKSFLAGPFGLPPSERLWPTVAASVLGALRGASFIRTHDVRAVREALERTAGLPAFTDRRCSQR